MRILVTGGAGFIGSAFVRLVVRERPEWPVLVLDKLTYAGNQANLTEALNAITFIRGDIADEELIRTILARHRIEAVVNFAAESHVDRSLVNGRSFIETDVLGTYALLTEARSAGLQRYVQVSTDEVYGSLATGAAREDAPLRPSNPYSASKAGGDLQVQAAINTHGVPAMITRGSNTYGPYHYPEKMIPLFITNLLEGKKVPVYGDGRQERDWLYVEDHARGILTVLERGTPGETYNLGSAEEYENLTVVRFLLEILSLGEEWIEYVADRPGHDRRYALDSEKAHALGWRPAVRFPDGLRQTVAWYKAHRDWWERLKRGEYVRYYAEQYGTRPRVLNTKPPVARSLGDTRGD